MAWRPQHAGAAWRPQVRPQGSWQANQIRPTGAAAGTVSGGAASSAGAVGQRPGATVVAPLKIPARVVPAVNPAVSSVPAEAGPETYVVSSKTPESDEAIVKALIGEYAEAGTNHERKVYKKVPETGAETVDIFLYFWDSRDGPGFEGWWFGNQVGGTQVFSHCAASSPAPPNSGWKIPWNGQVRTSLLVELKRGKVIPAQSAQPAGGIMGNPLMEAATAAKDALQQAQAAHGGAYSSFDQVQAAEEILQGHPQALAEALKKLMEAQQGAVGEQQRQYAQIGTIIRATQGQVNQEVAKLRAAKMKCEQAQKLKASEEKDAKILADVMPEATQKTNLAEDAVEKAVITAEMIEAASEDMDEVRQAVAQTESAAQEAQKAIGEARIYLNAKMAGCRRLESETVKEQANEQIGRLQSLLQECQNKLNPLKNVRQDFMQRTAAKKLVEEILEQLSPAEVDVDRAEEAAMLLTETVSNEAIQQAEQAVSKASDHVGAVTQLIASKMAGSVGVVWEELSKLEQRAMQSQQRLAHLKSQHKESTDKVVCVSIVQEAAEKLQLVAETVAKTADAEAPFLTGIEDLPLEETLAAVKVCETASTSANTAVSIARMFIATKLVEAKRLAAPASAEALSKLKEYQAELERHTKRLTELKRITASRKRSATMKEAETEVAKAEELARQVGEIASLFTDDAKLLELTAAEIREASRRASEAEQVANAALASARKFITGRQIESKGKETSTEVSSELMKFQTRLSSAQADVGNYKKMCGNVEGRLAAKKVIEEVAAKVGSAEEKVEKVSELVRGMDEAEASYSSDVGKKSAKVIESAAAEAQAALKTAGRSLESQTRAQGIAKEEIARMRPRIGEAQEKLDGMIATMREKSEKMIINSIIKETGERVKEAEDSVSKVAVAEQPFLEGFEDIPVEEASKLLNELDSAVQAAHSAVGGAKTFLAMKRLAAKRLSEASAKVAADEFTSLQSRVDAVAKKMSETKKGMAERKMATIKREAEAKVFEAEQKVQQATEATRAVTTDAEMAPEAMKGACEKAGTTQHEAHACIEETKTFLQNRQRDTKLMASDSSMPAEVTKMLERLSVAMSNLDKQRGLLRDQEHKFVAQRLLKDAVDQVDHLEALLQNVTKAAEPLTSEKSDFSAGVFLSHAVAAMKLHMTNHSKTAKALFEEIGEKGPITAARFVAFLEKLPELTEQKESMLSEEQLKASFARMDAENRGEVGEDEFLNHFRTRYVVNAVVSMTDGMAVKGGKTVRKLEVNEIVEQIDEPTKESGLNLIRVKARTAKDGKEGYITVSGTSTTFLLPYDPAVATEKHVEEAMQELVDTCSKAQKYVDTKVEELASVHAGPLAETKTALLSIGPRIRKVQHERKSLKSKIVEVRKRQQEAMENEKKRRQEALDQAAAEKMLEEVNRVAGEAEGKAEKVIETAQALVSSRGAETDNPLQAIDKTATDLADVAALVDKAFAKTKEHMDAVKNATKGPLIESRTMLVKVKAKVSALDSKCKKHIATLNSLRIDAENKIKAQRFLKDATGLVDEVEGLLQNVVSLAEPLTSEHSDISAGVFLSHAIAAMVTHMKNSSKTPEALFEEIGEKQPITSAKFVAFMDKLPELTGQKDVMLSEEHLNAAFARMATRGGGEVNQEEFLVQFRMKYLVNAVVSMTDGMAVKGGKTVRKLEVNETVEQLEEPAKEPGLNLIRVKAKAEKDGKEGYITVSGTSTTFLVPYDPITAMERKIEQAMQELVEAGSKAHSYVDSKVEELKSVHTGPLAETKTALMAMGSRIRKVQHERKSLKSRIAESRKKLQEAMENEKRRRREASDREVASKIAEEVNKLVGEAEEKVEKAVEIAQALINSTGSEGDNALPAIDNAEKGLLGVAESIDKALAKIKEHMDAIKSATKGPLSETRTMLLKVKVKVGSLDSRCKKQIVGLKSARSNAEQQIEAQGWLKDAAEEVDKLEALLQKLVSVAEPLISEKSGFSAQVFFSHSIAAVKLHMKNHEKTARTLFEEIGAEGSITAAKFVAFMEKLPELIEQKEFMLSEEQLIASFARMDTKGNGEVNEEEFLDHFKTRYLVNAVVSMTDGMVVKGGKTVRKLEANEVVEQLEEPTREPGLNLVRVKAKADKDGKEGYITVSGTSTKFLVPYDPITVMEKEVEKAIQDVVQGGSKTQEFVDAKVQEVRSARTGAWAEARSALLAMGSRIQKVQAERKSITSKLVESRKKQQEAMENAKKRRQEALEQAEADSILKEVKGVVGDTEEKVEKAVEIAQALVNSRGSESDNPLQAIDSAEQGLLALAELVEKALAKVNEHLNVVKNATKGPFCEARAVLFNLKGKVGSLESKCKKLIVELNSTRRNLTSDAEMALKNALRKHVVSQAIKPHDLFKKLSEDGHTVSAQTLRAVMEGIPGSGLTPSQVDLGIESCAAGLTKLTLIEMMHEYQRCVKDIAITTAYELKESKTIRKLLVGELVEVLEARKESGAGSLSRVRCRALNDQKEGWATLKGNQGTAFMERCPKPYYCCEEPAILQAGFESSSAEVGEVRSGEVLEVLEGPRQEGPLEMQRVKVAASKDGKSGWATLKDLQGRARLEPAKLWLCKQSIAITTTFDITEGKALRKLDVGEALEVLEGPKEDPSRNLVRVRAKAKTDGLEGWITMKGNQGTSYVEEDDKHYICKISTALERKFASGSESVRQLQEGEVVEITDGPKAETKEGIQRFRGRNVGSGEEGWLPLAGKNFQPWAPRYKCVQSTVINDAVAIKEAKAIRKLEVGEMLEALEVPFSEKAAGLLRIKVRAEKDGAAGFATVRGNQGTVFLKPCVGGGGGGGGGRERGDK